MKKVVYFFLLLIMSASSFCQQTNPPAALTKQDYLLKSKNQKKAAWIMLGGGAALTITGVIFPKGESKGFTGSFYGISNWVEEYENDGIKDAFMGVGLLSMLGSIPVFIASGKNNKRAMSVSFKKETAPQIQKNSFVYRSIPSVNLKISL